MVYDGAKRRSEGVCVQVRTRHSLCLKRGKYKKHSIEGEEVYPYPSFSDTLMSDRSFDPNPVSEVE